MRTQNSGEEKPGTRLPERLNESTGQKTTKRKKAQLPKKRSRQGGRVKLLAKGQDTIRRMWKLGERWHFGEKIDRKRMPPGVIITPKRGEGPYVDILRMVQTVPEHRTDLGDNISCIRWPQKRDFILELKKSKDIIANKCFSQIRKSTGSATGSRKLEGVGIVETVF